MPKPTCRKRRATSCRALGTCEPLEVRILLSPLFDANAAAIPGEGQNALKFAPDGRLAQLLWHGTNLVYRLRDDAGAWREEIVTEDLIGGDHFEPHNIGSFRDHEQAQLLFTTDGTAHVLLLDSGIGHYRRNNAGWSRQETIAFPEADDGSSVHLAAAVGLGNALHVAATIRRFDAETPGAVLYGTNKSGAWKFEHVANIGKPDGYFKQAYAPRYFSLAVDFENAAHLVYTPEFQNVPNPGGTSRPFSQLAYATNRSGSWTTQIIWQPADDSGDAGLGASIAVSPGNQVAVAHFHDERVATGSPESSRLLYSLRQPNGTWSTEVVTASPDGYVAGDGARFTGFAPQLVFDALNRPHIAFSDHASQHFAGFGADEFAGQIRHAVKAGLAWTIETVFRQTDPIRNQMVYPAMALSPYEQAFLGMRRQDELGPDSTVQRSDYFVEFLTITTATDPRPRIALPQGGDFNFLEGSSPLVFVPGTVVTDADSPHFANGELTVTITAGASGSDRLEVRHVGVASGQIGVSADTVTFGGQPIGTFSGGAGSTPLRVALNDRASPLATQALVRNITFRVLGSKPPVAQRTIEFRLTDGGGNISPTAAARVNVIPLRTTADSVRMYRAYNPNADYHFFTTAFPEFANAVSHGYRDESSGRPGYAVWNGYVSGTAAIHRMYNPNNGRHYYTIGDGERDFLVTIGWRYEKDEGFMFPAPATGTTEIYRLYNHNSGVHLYTENAGVKGAILAQFPGIWVQHSSLGFATAISVAEAAVAPVVLPEVTSREHGPTTTPSLFPPRGACAPAEIPAVARNSMDNLPERAQLAWQRSS